MVSKIFGIFILLFSLNSSPAPSVFHVDPKTEFVCLVKLGLINWLFTEGKFFSVDEQILQWNTEYKKINTFFPNTLTYTTSVDAERIIREVKRNKEKLQTPEQQKQFINQEIGWCIYYKH